MRFIILLLLGLLVNIVYSQTIQFPIKASADKKFITDQQDNPVFLNGCSAWRLPYALTNSEVEKFLADRKSKGFNTLLIHITPDLPSYKNGNKALRGEPAFYDYDLGKPNEKFFSHLDTVLNMCLEKNMIVMIAPMYLACCQDGWLEIIQQYKDSEKKCREYGQWFASRYKHFPNLVWVGGGDHNAVPESIAFSEGIASVDSSHLHTFHAHPGKSSGERLQGMKWHTLSAAYTYFPALEMNKDWQYTHVYTMLYEETLNNYHMPCILIESAYEEERNATEQTIRRQAWWALLGGASGHIYGHRDIYSLNENWKKALKAPGAESMKIFYSFIQSVPWYSMKADWPQTLFVNGRGNFNATILPGGDDYAAGAISKDSSVAVLYMPTYRSISVNMKRFRSDVTISWFDPSDGTYTPVHGNFKNSGMAYLKPPAFYNKKGFDDWVVVIRTKK